MGVQIGATYESMTADELRARVAKLRALAERGATPGERAAAAARLAEAMDALRERGIEELEDSRRKAGGGAPPPGDFDWLKWENINFDPKASARAKSQVALRYARELASIIGGGSVRQDPVFSGWMVVDKAGKTIGSVEYLLDGVMFLLASSMAKTSTAKAFAAAAVRALKAALGDAGEWKVGRSGETWWSVTGPAIEAVLDWLERGRPGAVPEDPRAREPSWRLAKAIAALLRANGQASYKAFGYKVRGPGGEAIVTVVGGFYLVIGFDAGFPAAVLRPILSIGTWRQDGSWRVMDDDFDVAEVVAWVEGGAVPPPPSPKPKRSADGPGLGWALVFAAWLALGGAKKRGRR